MGTSDEHKEDSTKKDSGSDTTKVDSGSSSPQRSVKKPVLPPSMSKPNLDVLAGTNQQHPSSNTKSPPAPPPKPSKEADSSEAKKTTNSLKDATNEPVTEVEKVGSLKETTTESVPLVPEVKKTSLKEKSGEPIIETNQQHPSSNTKSPPAPPPKPSNEADSKEADSSEAKKTTNSLKDATNEPVTEVEKVGSLKETTTESVPLVPEVKKTSLKEKSDEPIIERNKTTNPSMNEAAKESLDETKKESLKEVAKEPVDLSDGDIPIPITQPTALIGNPPITRPKPPMKHPKPKVSVPIVEGKAVTPEIPRKNIETKETTAVEKTAPKNVVKKIPEAAAENATQKASTDLEKIAGKISEEDKSVTAEKTNEKNTTKESDDDDDDDDVVPLTAASTTTKDVSTEKSSAPKPKPKPPKTAEKDFAKGNDVVEGAPQTPSTAANDGSTEKSVVPKPKPKPRSSTKTQLDIPKDEEGVVEDKEEQDIPVVVSYTPDSDSVKERDSSGSPNGNGIDKPTTNVEDTKDNDVPSPKVITDEKVAEKVNKSEISKDDEQNNVVTSNGDMAAEVGIVDDSEDGLYSVVTLNRRSEEREESPTVESTIQRKPTRTHHYDSVPLSPRPSPSPDLEPEYDVISDVRISKEPLSAKESNYDNWKLKKLPPKQSSSAGDDGSYAVIDHVPAVSVNIPNDATSSETQHVSVTSPVPLSVAASTIPQYAQVCKSAKKKKSISPDGGPQAEEHHFDLIFEQLGSSVPDHLNQAKEILRLAQVVRQEAEQMKKEAAEDREIARKERIEVETLKKNATEILKQAKEKAAAS